VRLRSPRRPGRHSSPDAKGRRTGSPPFSCESQPHLGERRIEFAQDDLDTEAINYASAVLHVDCIVFRNAVDWTVRLAPSRTLGLGMKGGAFQRFVAADARCLAGPRARNGGAR